MANGQDNLTIGGYKDLSMAVSNQEGANIGSVPVTLPQSPVYNNFRTGHNEGADKQQTGNEAGRHGTNRNPFSSQMFDYLYGTQPGTNNIKPEDKMLADYQKNGIGNNLFSLA